MQTTIPSFAAAKKGTRLREEACILESVVKHNQFILCFEETFIFLVIIKFKFPVREIYNM